MSLLYKLLGIMVLAASIFAGGMRAGWALRGPQVESALAGKAMAEATLKKAQADAVATVAKVQLELGDKVAAAEKKAAEKRVRIEWRTKEVLGEIPALIPPAVDRTYPLPNGFVCVLNAAAAGDSGDAPTAGSPCPSPGDPSAVAASDAAATLVDWAGLYHNCAAEVIGLQELYRAQQAAFAGAGGGAGKER